MDFLDKILKRVRMARESVFSVSFCIFVIYSYVPTRGKNFKSEAHDMKSGLFKQDL